MRSDLRVVASWPLISLGEVANLTLGGTPSTEVPAFWNGTIPWMASGDVNLREVFSVPGRISESGLRSSNATLVPPPAVAIGLAGQGKTRGTVACTHIELCTNQSIALVKGDEQNAHTRFLFHNLAARYEELRARSSGGGRGGLSKGILEALPMRLPPIVEQRRIADILDTVDDAIRQTERVIAKLEQVKAGMLQDLLTRGIDDNGEVRDPERHPEQFKDSPLGPVPDSWRLSEIGAVAGCLSGFAFPSSGFNDESGLRLIRIRDLLGGSELTYFRGGFEDRYLVQDGDLLVGMDGDFNAVEWSGGQALLNQRVCRVAPRSGAGLDARYLRHILQPILNSIHRSTPQTTVRHLAASALLSYVVRLPPQIEQRRIAERLDQHEARSRREVEVLAKLRATKQALADDLLTGRVRVNPREAVPA